MSNADLLSEAISTIIRLGWAFLAWLAVLAAITTLLLLAVTAGIAWTVRALWRGFGGPSWARSTLRARIYARRRLRRPSRRTAPWARTQPIAYDEAA